jgi:hypothetical protein
MEYRSMLRPWLTARLAMLCCSALIVLVGGGCGGNGSAALLSDEVARTALDLALKAWQGGGKPGPVAGTEPPVVVHDTPWAQGKKLQSFEILPAEPGGTEKRFSVRLSLTNPAGVQEAQYYVIGGNPVQVFRDEDYLRNINMVDGPKLPKPGTAARKQK